MFGTPLEFFTIVLPSLKRRPYTLLFIVLLPGISIIFLYMMDLFCPESCKELVPMLFVPLFFLFLAAIITAIVAIVAGWVRGRVRIIIVLALMVYVAFFLWVYNMILKDPL